MRDTPGDDEIDAFGQRIPEAAVEPPKPVKNVAGRDSWGTARPIEEDTVRVEAVNNAKIVSRVEKFLQTGIYLGSDEEQSADLEAYKKILDKRDYDAGLKENREAVEAARVARGDIARVEMARAEAKQAELEKLRRSAGGAA